MDECIFCKIIKGEIPSKKIYEDEKFFAFLDIAPVNKGHTLVIPKKHYKNLLDMPEEELNGYMKAVKNVSDAVIKGVNSDGINISMSNEEAAEKLIRAAVAINGPNTRQFPSRDAIKAEGIDLRTISLAKRFLRGVIFVDSGNRFLVSEKMKSLGNVLQWVELMQSEENADRNELMERVVEENDAEESKANALIVLKKAIQKYSRNGNKFPRRDLMSYPVYLSGMAYLKQFGLTTVIGGMNNGIFISSSSAFTNLGELYDYIND